MQPFITKYRIPLLILVFVGLAVGFIIQRPWLLQVPQAVSGMLEAAYASGYSAGAADAQVKDFSFGQGLLDPDADHATYSKAEIDEYNLGYLDGFLKLCEKGVPDKCSEIEQLGNSL